MVFPLENIAVYFIPKFFVGFPFPLSFTLNQTLFKNVKTLKLDANQTEVLLHDDLIDKKSKNQLV